MSEEYALQKEREKLAKQLQDLPDRDGTNSHIAEQLVGKISACNARLGKGNFNHDGNPHKLRNMKPTFHKTYK